MVNTSSTVVEEEEEEDWAETDEEKVEGESWRDASISKRLPTFCSSHLNVNSKR